jgi:hypothetical protein
VIKVNVWLFFTFRGRETRCVAPAILRWGTVNRPTRERLSAAITYDKARFLLLYRPRRREAACHLLLDCRL